MGDNGGFDARNQGIVELINSVTSGGFAGGNASNIGVLNLAGGCCADVNASASAGAENFASDYKDMTCSGSNPTARIWTEFPGVVRLSQIGTGRPVYLSNGLADFDSGPDEIGAIGVAFLGSDMLSAYSNSKLLVWFDWQTFRDQYCSPCGPTVGQPSGTYANSILVRDIMDFLVVANATPTYTPTNTRTFTPTATSTFTNTRTYTPTNTPSFTNTVTLTFTLTFTRTNTPTHTFTNTPTDTFTYTLTNTPTNTRTNTPTNTITNTPSNTNTQTHTSTFTNTFTQTWTGTPPPTWTPTNTFTETNTFTHTYTLTNTNTPTNTNTLTNTMTQTNTFTVTNTRTNTPTNTDTQPATPTDTSTPTNTSTFTNTRTVTNTPTSTNTPTNTNTWTNTNTMTDTPTQTNTFTFTNTFTLTFTVTSTSTFTSTPTITMTLPPYPYILNIDIYNEAGEKVRELISTRASILVNTIILLNDNSEEINTITSDKKLQILIPGLETPDTNNMGDTIFLWDIKNNAGQFVDNGVYYIKISEKDAFGHTNVLVKNIAVINVKEYVEVKIFNSAGELIKTMRQNAINLPDNIALNVDDIISVKKGEKITLSYGEEPGANVIWDGLTDNGLLVSSGTYEVQVKIEKLDGKTQIASKTVIILNDSESIFGKLKIYPNPLLFTVSQKINFTWESSYSGFMSFKIYNSAGEFIRKLEGRLEAGYLVWDLHTSTNTKISSGLYVVIAEAKDINGHIQREIQKISVILK